MPQFDETFEGPLAGITVLDLSRLVAGNMVSLQLADYGAEVIKIEPVAKGDPLRHWVTEGLSLSWKVYSRNKKSVSLDLRQDDAKDILLRLVERADVMIESFTAGTVADLGIGYDVVRELNPSLVMVDTCLMGQSGPAAGFAGFGFHAAAVAGFHGLTGWPNLPPDGPWTAYTDTVSPRFLAATVMAALDHPLVIHQRCSEHGPGAESREW